MGESLLKVLKKDCRPEDAKDSSLPYTCYLVTYKEDGHTKHDLVVGKKKVEIFDYYWDLYRHDFVTMEQSDGRMNPKLWNDPNAKKKK